MTGVETLFCMMQEFSLDVIINNNNLHLLSSKGTFKTGGPLQKQGPVR